jgi:putative permease
MNKQIAWPIFIVCFGFLCYTLEAAITPFFVAFLIYYLVHPLIEKISTKTGHKSLVIAIVIAALLCLCGFLIMVITPVAYQQTSILASKIPAYKNYLQPIIMEKVSYLNPEVADRLNDALQSSFNNIITMLAKSVNNILSATLATFSIIVMIFLIPVILFYMLRDFSSMREGVEKSLPKSIGTKAHGIIEDINSLLSAYIRGQLKVCSFMAIYYTAGLSFIGLDLALILGVVSGFIIILPFVGLLISLVVALVFGYITFGFSSHMLAIAMLYFFGALLEGSTLTPKIIGDKIGLHPLWIIFAVLAGGTLFGFVGMLIAIPVAGIIKILLGAFLRSSK